MRSFVFGLMALACLALAAGDAEARIFRGCNSNGCSTSGCSTNSGCNVVRRNADPVQISNPAPRPVVTNPTPTPPPQIVKGDKGDKGEPGKDAEVTQAQLDYVVQQVASQLLVAVKNDPQFKGPQGDPGSANVAQIVQQVKEQLPTTEQIADEVARQLPPINVAFESAPGVTASTQQVKLGGTIRIPPINLATVAPDGTRMVAMKPLGSLATIRIAPLP